MEQFTKCRGLLPAGDKGFPLGICFEMPPENIGGRSRRFLGLVQEFHAGFSERSPTLVMIAGRTGSYHIVPHMFAAHVARGDVVDGQGGGAPTAVLAGGMVAAEDLAPGKLDARAGVSDLVFEPYDGGKVEQGIDRADLAAPVDHQAGLVRQNHTQSPADVAHVEGFIVCVQDQHGGFKFVHKSRL